MKRIITLLMFASMGLGNAAWGRGLEWRDSYVGVGGGVANITGNTELPSMWQAYIGLPVSFTAEKERAPLYRYSIEVGYTEVVDESQHGRWIGGVVERRLKRDLELLVRLGGEYGDHSGLRGTLGLDYEMGREFSTRLELTARPETTLMSINFIYQP